MRRRLTVVARVAPEDGWRARASAVVKFVWGRQHGGWPDTSDPDRDRWEPDALTEITWVTAQNFDEWARRYRIDRALPHDVTRRTEVVIHDGPEPTVSVVVADLPGGGAVRPLQAPVPAMPGVVVEGVRLLTVLDGGVRLQPITNDAADPAHVDALSLLITHPDRRLPIVVVRAPGTVPTTGPDDLGVRLAGLAHVHAVAPAGLARLAAMGLDVDVHGGAGIFWPGYRIGDRDDVHWWTPAGVSGAAGFRPASEPARLVTEAAVAAYEVPDVVGRLERAAARDRIRRLEDRTEHHHPAAAPAPAEGRAPDPTDDAGSSSEPFDLDEVLEVFSADLVELDALRLEVEALREENDGLRRSFAEFEENLPSAFTDLTQHGRPDVDIGKSPTSMRAAVQRARDGSTHLRFTTEAMAGADTWQYRNPERVLRDLLVLDRILAGLADRSLTRGLAAEALAWGLPWRSDVSRTALTKFRVDYVRTIDGREVLMGPHLAWGSKSKDATTYCRAYMWIDRSTWTAHVGHIGRHLRDASSS